MQLFPIALGLAVGFALFGRKKKKNTPPPVKSLAVTSLGEVFFDEELPDLIEAREGETFTVRMSPAPEGHYTLLSATPIDQSIVKLDSAGEINEDPKAPTYRDGSGDELWTFRANKKGEGSIVFHLRENGNLQPLEIDEINVKIS